MIYQGLTMSPSLSLSLPLSLSESAMAHHSCCYFGEMDNAACFLKCAEENYKYKNNKINSDHETSLTVWNSQ